MNNQRVANAARLTAIAATIATLLVGSAVSTLGNGVSQGLGQLGASSNPVGTTLASTGGVVSDAGTTLSNVLSSAPMQYIGGTTEQRAAQAAVTRATIVAQDGRCGTRHLERNAVLREAWQCQIR